MCHPGMAERYSITARSDEMNKTEMADHSAARTGLSKGAAKDVVDGVFAIVGEALADGEEVRLPRLEDYDAQEWGDVVDVHAVEFRPRLDALPRAVRPVLGLQRTATCFSR